MFSFLEIESVLFVFPNRETICKIVHIMKQCTFIPSQLIFVALLPPLEWLHTARRIGTAVKTLRRQSVGGSNGKSSRHHSSGTGERHALR